jgi:hypothetical protein
MERKMKIKIRASDLAIWKTCTSFLESRDLSFVRFQSIKQACNARARKNVLLIFCENRIIDST